MNTLPTALMNEAARIHQLLKNTDNEWWGGGASPGVYEYQFPDDTTVRYHIGGAVWLTLHGIHVTDLGPIQWQEEESVSSTDSERHEDHLELLAGDSAKRTLSWTFSDIQTLEDSTKLNLQSEAQAKLGSLYSPVSGFIDQKVEKEYASKFSDAKTYSQTETYELDIVGPKSVNIVFERDKQKRQRHTQCAPIFDYAITFHWAYDDGGWFDVTWKSKQEFIDFIRGEAPDTVGVLFGADRPLPPSFLSLNIGDTRVNHTESALAPWFRARPQPDAVIDNGGMSLTWTDMYDTVIDQSVREELVAQEVEHD